MFALLLCVAVADNAYAVSLRDSLGDQERETGPVQQDEPRLEQAGGGRHRPAAHVEHVDEKGAERRWVVRCEGVQPGHGRQLRLDGQTF